MSGCGFGYPVILVRVGEPSPVLGKPGESAAQLRAESGQVIAPKPVDRDHDYQAWALRCGGALSGRNFAAKSERGEKKKGFGHKGI